MSGERVERRLAAILAADVAGYSRLMHGKPADLIADAMIGATATVHNLTVVTRNLRDFERLGVRAFDPFR